MRVASSIIPIILSIDAVLPIFGKLRSPNAYTTTTTIDKSKEFDFEQGRRKAKAKKSKGKKKNSSTSSDDGGDECLVTEDDNDAFQLLAELAADPTRRGKYDEEYLADILEDHVDDVNNILPDSMNITHHDVIDIWTRGPQGELTVLDDSRDSSHGSQTSNDLFERQLLNFSPACQKDLIAMLGDVIDAGLYMLGMLGFSGLAVAESMVLIGGQFFQRLIDTWEGDGDVLHKIAGTFVDWLKMYSLPHFIAYIYENSTWYQFAVSIAGLAAALTAAVASAGISMIISGIGLGITEIDGILNLFDAVKQCSKKKD